MNYNYDYKSYESESESESEDCSREYISKERFKKTVSIKPTKKLFSLKLNTKTKTVSTKEEQTVDEIKPEGENIKLTWIKLKYDDEIKTSFHDSDYPSLTLDKNEIKEQKIISDEKENKKGWTKIEKKSNSNNEEKIEQDSKNIPVEIKYALSMLSSDKFIIFDGTKHYGLALNSNSNSNKNVDNNLQGQKSINNSKDKKNQEKTQMCRMYKDKKCRNGNNCRFAHSLSELVVNPCNFGKNCKCVKFQKDRYINFGEKNCVYRHPGESRNDYYKRNNL